MGLQYQVKIDVGDIRDRAADEVFDIVTLHNNIYYFPVVERVPRLRHVGNSSRLAACC
jgi:4-hydroxy-2,2'-bipyrrole-5-carbaldehyde O-methyltransferase